MERSALKTKAKSAIQGKIGILLVLYLVAVAVIYAASYLTAGIGAILLGGGWMLSLAFIYLAIVRHNKKPKLEDLLRGFQDNNFPRGLLGYIRYNVFILLWSLLLIVPGIIKSLAYAQMFLLMADDPKLDAGAAQKQSIALMEGHKGEFFLLQLSFIPWYLLVCVTFGLAAIYVAPYVQATYAEYYQYLKKSSKK